VGDAVGGLGRVGLDGRHADEYACLRRLDPLLHDDLALVIVHDLPAGAIEGSFRLRAHLGTRVLHCAFAVPVSDGKAVSGLAIPDERYATETLLLLDQWKGFVGPPLDRGVGIGRISLEPDDASMSSCLLG